MRKILGFTLFFALSLALHNNLQAQQDPQFTQYMFNTLYFNPAYAGVEGVTKIYGVHRNQWTGLEGAQPVTQVLSFNTPIFRLSSGFGLHAMHETQAMFNTIEFQGSYAYHLHIKELKTKVSFGVRGGIIARSNDPSKYKPNNPDDPLLKASSEYQVLPDVAAGVYFQSEKVWGGVAFNHLIKSEIEAGTIFSVMPPVTHMNFMLGYDYPTGRKITISPSVLVHTDMNEYTATLSVVGNHDDKIWAGLSFRQGESINILTGYSLLKDKSLRFGLAYDTVIKGNDAKSFGSYEVSLSYVLPAVAPSGKKIIRNPRFRHE